MRVFPATRLRSLMYADSTRRSARLTMRWTISTDNVSRASVTSWVRWNTRAANRVMRIAWGCWRIWEGDSAAMRRRKRSTNFPRIAQRDEGNLESCPGSGSVCRAGHGAPVTWQKRRNLERKEQQMRGTEGKPGKKAMRYHLERWACPRREHPEAAKASLRRRQTEESGEDFWDAEELDGGSVSGRGTGIARQPVFPRKAIMGALRAGKDSHRVVWLGRRGLRKSDLNPLVAQQAHAGSAMLSATPIRATSRGVDPTGSGCNSKLTRRGFVVVRPCHWHCTRLGHGRHWLSRAA